MSGLNEWQSNDGIDCDMQAGGNKDAHCLAIACQIWEMELKSHSQIRRDRFSSTLDNPREDDGVIILGGVKLGDTMGIPLGQSGHEMEVSHHQRCSHVHHASKNGAIGTIKCTPELQMNVGEVGHYWRR
jgi:hypothetical protein